MKYDPRSPVAVFLGPSLDRAAAEAILPANYYPPVRMGDLYRLLATGVRMIVIVDGVFHQTTPVWQREIRAAMGIGIAVVGASSMGALRGAELAALGMIGCGTIFGWYRDGVLDGDDEVALLHGDETLGYRPLSEPLVNVRWNLARAVDRGLLDATQSAGLVAFLKGRYFGERSYRALLDSPAAQGLPESVHDRLASFLALEAENLKRADALAALHHAADLLRELPPEPAPRARPAPEGDRAPFAALETLRRGLLRSDGELVSANAVLRVAVQTGALLPEDSRACAVRFYLARFADGAGVRAPPAFCHSFRDAWVRRQDAHDLRSWLPRAGMTAPELDADLEHRATCEWLLAQDPERHGLEFAAARRAVDALCAWLTRRAPDPTLRASLLRDATAGTCLSAWARSRGITCPVTIVAAFLEGWELEQGVGSREQLLAALGLDAADYLDVWSQRALYHWLLDRGPAHFGYADFSLDQALLRELQVSGRAFEIAERTAEGAL